MALIDKASLLMVPSTYEAGKLYNVLPSGNRAPDSTDQNSGYDQTRADFDFDRGSNAAATRIGSDGLLKKYRENLLLRSNQFDTTWANSSSSETDGQGGYDGTNNAWLLSKTAAGGRINQSVSLSGVQTLSMYAKAGTLNWMRFITIGGTTSSTYYDLENGVIGANISSIDTNIESVGNGWYRCSVTTNQPLTEIRIYPADADNDTSGTTGSIYIQSAQLETGLVATDYLNSTDVTGKAGVLIDMPRINYDANGENGSLLLEPSRQQLIQYSEYFGTSAWQNVGCTITENQTTSPEGLRNATLIAGTSSGGTRVQDYLGALTGNHTFSIYIKSTGSATRFNFQTNDIGGATFSVPASGAPTLYAQGTNIGEPFIEDAGNGWYRVGFTFAPTGGAVSNYFQLYPDSAGNSSSIYAFGAMAESGSYPTSLIPNHGTSGGVTRAADSMSKDDLSTLIHSPEGTLFLEVAALADDGTNRFFSITDGTTSNYIYFRYVSTSNNMLMRVVIGGVTINTLTYVSPDTTILSKVALKWKGGDYAFWVNGLERSTDTSAASFGAGVLNEIVCDFPTGSGASFPSKTKQVAVFNEALSDSELATLTTL